MAVIVPDEVLQTAGISEDEARLALALRLFEDDRLTLARAARLAGLTYMQFQQELGKRQIPVHYGMEQMEADLRRAGFTPA